MKENLFKHLKKVIRNKLEAFVNKKLKRLDKLILGEGRGLDFNRHHGMFQVRYPDGMLSQRFCWDVANNYKNIFGGIIVSIRERFKHYDSK